ncbi:MAG: hypothetical protein C0406_08320 [Sideroxydans sp.]|nr:hypothetical protein [Sideroxydans sp.]
MVAFGTLNTSSALNNLLRNFDEVLEGNISSQHLIRYATSDSRPNINQNDLIEIRARHSIEFTTALQITMLRRRHQFESKSAESIMDDLGNRGYIKRVGEGQRRSVAQEIEISGSNVVSVRSDEGTYSHLKSVWRSGLIDKYILDTGVPYANYNTMPSILLADNWPSMKTDPDKPARVAAFSGWIIAQPSTTEDIEELVKRAQYITRKRINERT